MDGIASMLDYRELTAVYNQAATLAGTPFVDEFFSNPQETGDEVAMFTIGTNNSPAAGNTRGSMPRVQQAPSLSKAGAALFHSFNTMPVPFDKLAYLNSKSPDVVRVGQQYLNSAFQLMGRRQGLFREAILESILNYGKVNLGATGDVLQPSVNATSGVITDNASTQVSADFQLPNSHRGRCLIGGGVYVFSGVWDTTTTDIIAELDLLRDQALKTGCERPTTIHLHALRKQKLINSDKFKSWAIYNQMTNDKVLSMNEFSNVWGWNFKFHEGYITDAAGVQQPIIPVRQAIITPDDGPWKQSYEGVQRVPTTAGEILNASADSLESMLSAAMARTSRVRGKFAFGHLLVSPLIQLNLITGDNFGMGFPNANGSWWAPTVFAA